MAKKLFSELTPAGQKKRITAIQKELASKNLRQELVQIVSIKRNGQQLPPKATPVVKDGQELGHNVLFRIRRADFKWSIVNGVKTIQACTSTQLHVLTASQLTRRVTNNQQTYSYTKCLLLSLKSLTKWTLTNISTTFKKKLMKKSKLNTHQLWTTLKSQSTIFHSNSSSTTSL